MDFISTAFGWLLDLLYDFTSSYGLALIIFGVLVKVILLPVTAKTKKNSMKMSRIQPRVQQIQQKYAGDQVKMNEELQKLYKSENVSMGGGCLWSFIPLLILFPLISVVREPITYMLGVEEGLLPKIFEIMSIDSKDPYAQIAAASQFSEFAAQLKELGIGAKAMEGIDFNFLGFNLAQNPEWKVWTDAWAWNWAHIGPFLIPVLSALSQVGSMLIAQRMNNSVITNSKGLEDKDAAKNSQANQSMKMMMWTMPLISLLIGFGYPAALSLYWFIQGLISIIIDVVLTQRYRKIYDEEDAIRLQLTLEQERLEAEKERIRAERRAANPDGITENTSKKKLQKKLQNEQEAAKAAAKREYEAKKGIVAEEAPVKEVMSGIADRPYCKGRNYDPNRYSNTEE